MFDGQWMVMMAHLVVNSMRSILLDRQQYNLFRSPLSRAGHKEMTNG